ncbi:5739_t:CDS:1, partial [Racocetra persica]
KFKYHDFKVENLVLVARSDIAISRSVKFEEKFKGPYYIYRKLENGAYKPQTKE